MTEDATLANHLILNYILSGNNNLQLLIEGCLKDKRTIGIVAVWKIT